MSVNNFFRQREPNDHSTEAIAHRIASCATLAVLQQYTVDYRPGRITRCSQSNFSDSISTVVSIYKPMSELATRGAMVERGHIDFDEIDLGWIIAQSIVDGHNWYTSLGSTIGRLLLFSPIASGAGYLFSELDQLNDPFEMSSLLEYTELVIENTTPEDTVNLYSVAVDKGLYLSDLLHDPSSSLPDEIEKILEDELNLSDMFHYNQQNDLIFEEITTNYTRITKEGLSAFLEIINEGLSFQDAITHTYISLMSMLTDTSVYRQHGRIVAQKLRKDALEVVELGGLLTEKGKDALQRFDKNLELYDNHLAPQSIDDLTTAVTFLAVLAGVKP